MDKRVTIYDLAKALDVSPSYISKALNDHPSVSESMKEKVRRKAQELGYKYNLYAANLRRGTSNTIGVIVPIINKSFFSEAIAGIEEVCSKHHYGLIICQSHDSYETECKAIDTLIRQNVDCIILSVSSFTESPEHLEEIRHNGIKVITFDRFVEEFPSSRVINDNEQMTFRATQHLISEGYRNIAFIGWTPKRPIYRLRREGFIRAMREAGLPLNNDFIIEDVHAKESTIDVARRLLSQTDRPDAFITVSDLQAMYVLKVAQELGIKVPEELGIIGFGNDSVTTITSPTLSSVDQKSKELGIQAANIYFADLCGKKKDEPENPRTVTVEADLCIRESSARKH